MAYAWKSSYTKYLGLSASVFAGFFSYYLPQTKLLLPIKSLVQLYKYEEAHPVDANLVKLHLQVMKDLEIPQEKRENIDLFITYGFKVFSMGSIWSTKWINYFDKAIVGIPLTYTYDKVEEISTKGICINGDTIDWYSDYGLNLKASCILSEKGKKFSLAQQTYEINTPEPLLKATLTSIIATLTVALCAQHRRLDPVFRRSKGYRYVMYFGVCALTTSMWVMLTDLIRVHYEYKSDSAVAALGEDYIEGGKEYYDQILNMNTSLGQILNGSYTRYGNEKVIIRQPHLQITARRDFMEKKIQELSSMSPS